MIDDHSEWTTTIEFYSWHWMIPHIFRSIEFPCVPRGCCLSATSESGQSRWEPFLCSNLDIAGVQAVASLRAKKPWCVTVRWADWMIHEHLDDGWWMRNIEERYGTLDHGSRDFGRFRLSDFDGITAGSPRGRGSLQGCLWPRVARPCASTASSGRCGNQGVDSVDSVERNMLKLERNMLKPNIYIHIMWYYDK